MQTGLRLSEITACDKGTWFSVAAPMSAARAKAEKSDARPWRNPLWLCSKHGSMNRATTNHSSCSRAAVAPFERRCCAARSRQTGDNSPREVSLTNKKAGDTPRASAHRSDGVVPSRGGPLPNRHLVGSRVARHDPDISGCESPVEGDRSQQNEPGTGQAWPLPSRRSTADLPQNTLTNPAFYAASGTLSDSSKNRTERRSVRHKTGCGITGDPSPSETDMRLTRRLSEAARILQIQLVDHVIVGSAVAGRSPYFSFKEGGIIG
jgi:RadC-like JAB domain